MIDQFRNIPVQILRWHLLFVIIGLGAATTFATAQSEVGKKYPSLLWEITGNGITKPSYLFGTMHVSSKLAFHLGDSFFNAIESVDVVALEVDAAFWQKNMVELDRLSRTFSDYFKADNYSIRSGDFELPEFERMVMYALRSKPYVINSLLFRSNEYMEDYEEDTYLDMYIYQTGRRLGKICTGLENFLESERLEMEAYIDMYYDKKKKSVTSAYGRYNNGGLTDAYRNGDLDKLDSINNKNTVSPAFQEKFLFKRNEIQANGIDSVIRTRRSIFAGVGAAHLPGERGVIELLRKKGYTLKPIKMKNRDAPRKETLERVRVPVPYRMYTTDDSLMSLMLPGELYSAYGGYRFGDSKQVADMANGAYITVSRIPTYSSLMGLSIQKVASKIDSMLYESVPGKILKRTSFVQQGIKGIEILNKTRRGDVHRSRIYILPFEVVIVRISGTGEYILKGTEAETLFSTLTFHFPKAAGKGEWKTIDQSQKGFRFSMPGEPLSCLVAPRRYSSERYEYRYTDTTDNSVYMLLRSSVLNDVRLEADSLTLLRVHNGILSSDYITSTIKRSISTLNSYPCLDVSYRSTDSSIVYARIVLSETNVYTMLAKGASKGFSPDRFFSSLSLLPVPAKPLQQYHERFGGFTVQCPFHPYQDSLITPLMFRTMNLSGMRYNFTQSSEEIIPEEIINRYKDHYNDFQFRDPNSGEWVRVMYEQYGRFTTFRDSALFWKQVSGSSGSFSDCIIRNSTMSTNSSGWVVHSFDVYDTATTSGLRYKVLLKNNILYYITTSLPSEGKRISNWRQEFFDSFVPEEPTDTMHLFGDKFSVFVSDYDSKDSMTAKAARMFISEVTIRSQHLPELVSLINGVKQTEKDYFGLKKDMIELIGDMRDTTHPERPVEALRMLSNSFGDTTTFQSAIYRSLKKLKSKQSYALLKELIIQDPPDVSDFSEDTDNDAAYYTRDRYRRQDSLKLSVELFPDILQLASIDQYKPVLLKMLSEIVDSNLINTDSYESYYQRLMFDAKFLLKKVQISNDEESAKELREKNKSKTDNNSDDESSAYRRYRSMYQDTDNDELRRYAVLLLPFYDKQPAVRRFFDKLLTAKASDIRIMAVSLLASKNKSYPDSVLVSIAADSMKCGELYKTLQYYGQLDAFPKAYRNTRNIAVSLIRNRVSETLDSIVFYKRELVTVNNTTGYVYIFKIRSKTDGEWQLGYAGVFPDNESDIQTKEVTYTVSELPTDKSIDKVIELDLLQLLFDDPYGRSSSYYDDNDE